MRKIVFFTLLLSCIFSQLWGQKTYKNLVFEGGGVRGIAYVGALSVLEDKNMLAGIERVGGTSAGAITSLLLATGYSVKEMEEILWKLKVQSFNDRFSLSGLNHKLGLYRGDKFEGWLKKMIRDKTGNENLTFEELHTLAQRKQAKDLFVVGTNLTKQNAEVFSYLTSPKMSIALAVRISMSIPFYYRAVILDEQGQRVAKISKKTTQNYSLYVDGGITQNYPIGLFDNLGDSSEHSQTLGFKLERPEQVAFFQQSDAIAPYNIKNIKDYTGAFYNLLIESANRNHPISDEKERTVYISTIGILPKVKKNET